MTIKSMSAKAATGTTTAKQAARAKQTTTKHNDGHKADQQRSPLVRKPPLKSNPQKKIPTEHGHRLVSAAAPKAGLSRTDTLIKILKTREGASIEQLADAVGWQHHSVRGALSGILRKRLGLNVVSEQVGDTRIYRIAK